MSQAAPSRSTASTVTAVVVGAADSPYLPATLSALAAQTRSPEEVLLVGVGPTRPATAAELEALVTEAGLRGAAVRIAAAPGATTFGDAVRRSLAERPAPPIEDARHWLWLLHDDAAPEPAALAELVRTVETGRSIAVAGTKQVDWDAPDRLISVGVRNTPDGQRFTGIEDGEIDQGQHDGREDVYAVGTAGMLVDAELWRVLGGPDPELGPFLDGRDVSRRARLAGHRVVVVPTAVVRHARAGYQGLREPDGSRTRKPVAADPRRSFRARREAVLHARLTQVPVVAVPFVVLAALVAAPLRALWRVATKEIGLAPEELWAPLGALARPRAVARSRRRAAATRTMPHRRLRPLQAGWADVWRVRRDLRLQATAERRAARAPSELEMAERAAVGTRRRLTLAGVLLLAGVLSAFTIAPVAFSGALTGGALLPVDASFGELWRAALAPWIATGDGAAGPQDPFLGVLGVLSLLTGGPLGTPVTTTIALLAVLAMPLAALGGWFAAGTATRSMTLRAWAAMIWALGPPLLIGLGQGRLGAVVAHLALPFMALGIARALGVDRRDAVLSGMVGAQRVTAPRRPTARVTAREAKRSRLAALAAVAEEDARLSPMALTKEPAAGPGAVATGPSPRPADARDGFPWGSDVVVPIPSNSPAGYVSDQDVPSAVVVSRRSGVGSLGAAAAAGLAFTVAAAGAPVLLPAGVLCLVALALALGRRRHLVVGRGRLVLVALPAVAVFAPLLTHALRTWRDGGWRIFLASPGAPLASDPGEPWLALLAWPTTPGVAPVLGGAVGEVLPVVACATVVVAALLAMLRGSGRARAVRIGWLVAVVGLAAALGSSRVAVGVGRATGADAGADVVVNGWAGPGTSLVLLGLLLATVVAADGLRGSLSGQAFGWQQLTLAVVTVALVLAPALAAGLWTHAVLRERSGVDPGTLVTVHARGDDPVPALGLELQSSPQRARVLALTPTADAIDAQLWRSNGPQLTETSTAVEAARLRGGDGASPVRVREPDAAATDLAELVAELGTGTVADAARRLSAHAVAVVVVPPADSRATGVSGADDAARARLVALLDSVLGLDRVTENPSGTIWRVRAGEGSTDESTARAQVLDGDGALVQNVASRLTVVEGPVSAEGVARTLVLAERADPGWHAWLDGRPLRAVAHGWQQAFEIPDDGSGQVVVRFEPPVHRVWRVVGIVVLALTALLALPTRRRRMEDV